MNRLNLSLPDETIEQLEAEARKSGRRRAAVARDFLCEGLKRHRAAERRRALAADYVASRFDDAELLRDWQDGQLELLGEEDD